MNEVVLKVENLVKVYRLGEIGTGTISHDLNRWWAKIRGKEDPLKQVGVVNDRSQKGKKGEYVKVLDNINFDVRRGEVLGVIGKNGAGKSTLLKVISQITAPSAGRVKINGRIASLLEVGTGMHPEMTGKENVYLNGTILGMSKKEIDAKFDEIMKFAGCSKYADTPIKRYSSGMKVRLGFAVAAFLEPEILIVDEVLAVGDAEFQKKAIGKMQDITSGNRRTVIFVSHNMASIKQLCKNAVVLDKGTVIFSGPVRAAIDYYLQDEKNRLEKLGVSKWSEKNQPGCGTFKLTKVRTVNTSGNMKTIFSNEEEIVLEIHTLLTEEIHNMRLNFRLLTENDIVVFSSSSHSSENIKKPLGIYVYNVIIPAKLLNAGVYLVQLQAGIPNVKQLLEETKVIKIVVEKLTFSGTTTTNVLSGIVAPDIKWKIMRGKK